MSTPDGDIPDRIHRLAIRQLDGVLTDDERADLAELLRGDPEARRVYLAHMQDAVSLRWMFSGHCDRRTLTLASDRRLGWRRGRAAVWTLVAAAAAVACVAAWPYWRPALPPQIAAKTAEPAPPAEPAAQASAHQIATVTAVSSVKWNEVGGRAAMLSRVIVGQQFSFSQGAVELTFDTDLLARPGHYARRQERQRLYRRHAQGAYRGSRHAVRREHFREGRNASRRLPGRS